MSRYDNLPDSKTDINPYDGADSYAMISSSSSSSSSPDFIDKAPGPVKSHNNLTIPDLSTFHPSALRSLTTSPFPFARKFEKPSREVHQGAEKLGDGYLEERPVAMEEVDDS